MASIRSFIVRQLTRQYMVRRRDQAFDLHRIRGDFEKRMTMLPSAPNVRIGNKTFADIDCEIHVPTGCDDAPLMVFLHGGAYIMGSPATHRRMISFLAKGARVRAVVPDYRLAPENRHPAQIEDALSVWHALMAEGETPARTVIGGESAGGNLTMATLLSLRDAGEELPAACFLMSPWLDLAAAGESYSTRAKADPWFRPQDVQDAATRYADEAMLTDPVVSSVYADVSGLPPTFVQVGDDEILLSDSTTLAENLRAAGVRTQIQVWEGMWHAFQYFVGQMPESGQAIDAVSAFLRSELSIE